MFNFLVETEGIQSKEDISVATVTAGLEGITADFLLCLKAWAQDGRTRCMLRQGRGERSQTDYWRWWDQEGIDL